MKEINVLLLLYVSIAIFTTLCIVPTGKSIFAGNWLIGSIIMKLTSIPRSSQVGAYSVQKAIGKDRVPCGDSKTDKI